MSAADRGAAPRPRDQEVLRELDSYRDALRAAFDEGYAAARNDSGIRVAWERSEARQTEWMFAHTCMLIGAIVREAAAVTGGRLREQLEQLVGKWRSNADMLAEGNKGEWPSEGAGMQRSCAKDLADLLAGDPQDTEQDKDEDHAR